MNLAFTQPDKLGERARLARRFLDAVERDRPEEAKKLEKEILEQLRITGHLTRDPSVGAYIEWQSFEFGIVHVNYCRVPPPGQPFDDAFMDDPANADHWLEINPDTGEVKQL